MTPTPLVGDVLREAAHAHPEREAYVHGEKRGTVVMTQALPILRGASHEDADHVTKDAARRRLGVIREVLHALITPQFGKRRAPVKLPTREECYRQLLGLPLDRRLSNAEIHRAYKLVAKHAHPDAGGNVKAFLELSAARDALMKEQRARPRN